MRRNMCTNTPSPCLFLERSLELVVTIKMTDRVQEGEERRFFILKRYDQMRMPSKASEILQSLVPIKTKKTPRLRCGSTYYGTIVAGLASSVTSSRVGDVTAAQTSSFLSWYRDCRMSKWSVAYATGGACGAQP